MFSGAQVALYPMSDDFVGVILGALSALDPYRPDKHGRCFHQDTPPQTLAVPVSAFEYP